MSKYRVIDVWNERFGNKEGVYDYAGRLMKKSACGSIRGSYVPTIDHIRPLSEGRSSYGDRKILVAILHQFIKSLFVL